MALLSRIVLSASSSPRPNHHKGRDAQSRETQENNWRGEILIMPHR
jgi:hypothetical protein